MHKVSPKFTCKPAKGKFAHASAFGMSKNIKKKYKKKIKRKEIVRTEDTIITLLQIGEQTLTVLKILYMRALAAYKYQLVAASVVRSGLHSCVAWHRRKTVRKQIPCGPDPR